MPKVFISYAHEDYGSSKRLYDRLLLEKDIEPWLDKEKLLPGMNWKHEIRKAIRESRYFVAILSSQSVSKRGFFQTELKEALEVYREFPQGSIYLIPVRLDECETPEDTLDEIHYIDLFPDWEDGYQRILKAIRIEPPCQATLRITARDYNSHALSGIPVKVSRVPSDGDKARLEQWIDESTNRFSSLVENNLPNEKPSRYSQGTYMVAYSLVGSFEPPSLGDLLGILSKIRGNETDWPPWLIMTSPNLAPYPYEGIIECWLKDSLSKDAAHSDFWRASPQGMMFLVRGYEEDSEAARLKPGTILDLVLPIWRIAEYLLHAERLARELKAELASVVFCVKWSGLSGRVLRS